MVALLSLDQQHSYGPFSHVGCHGEARHGRSRQDYVSWKSTLRAPLSRTLLQEECFKKNVLNKCLEFAGNHASVQPVFNWANCLFAEHTSDRSTEV